MENSPRISIIIPVYNASAVLLRCLEAVFTSCYQNFECIVVDDGSTDDSQDIARQYGARVIELKGGPRGPAFARNCGVQEAAGEIVFFIDADVVIQPDTLDKVEKTFIDHPEYDATFGSYDEAPGDGQFLSLYKNLSHHFVHQTANQEGHTFWTGCGAIRRDVFLKLGGFDIQRYPHPSIEDIELGIRLRSTGHRILVNKDIQVKHLKRWTFLKLIKTDVMDRAIPWTLLILHEQNLPNDLNLNQSQRLSALLTMLMLADLGLGIFFHSSLILLPLLAVLFLAVVSSWQFYEGTTLFKMGKVAESLTYSVMIVVAGLAFYLKHYDLLPPLALLLAVMLAGKFLPARSVMLRHILFALVMLSLIIGFILIFISYPLWATLPLLFCTILIFWLNRSYYYFFARVRKPVFTLAVFPFQLLYYLYSVFAFVTGHLIHFFRRREKITPKPEEPA